MELTQGNPSPHPPTEGARTRGGMSWEHPPPLHFVSNIHTHRCNVYAPQLCKFTWKRTSTSKQWVTPWRASAEQAGVLHSRRFSILELLNNYYNNRLLKHFPSLPLFGWISKLVLCYCNGLLEQTDTKLKVISWFCAPSSTPSCPKINLKVCQMND